MTTIKMDLMEKLWDGTPFGVCSAVASPASPELIPEHAIVRAVKDIREGSLIIPEGAIGTVVHVVKGGRGYYVEFTEPVHEVISALRSELSVVQSCV